MRRASTITNKHDGRKYDISTARNPYGVWETAVFGRGFLGLPKLTKPLWVQNTTSEEEAKSAHDLTEEMVANLPRGDWERSYSVEGRLGKGQRLVRNTGRSNSKYSPGISQHWLSIFGGKPNTEEVLRKKAEVLAQLAIANGEAGRELVSKLGDVPEGGEQANQGFDEMVMLTLHFADRMAYEFLPEPQRVFFTDCLVESTAVALAQRDQVTLDTPAFEELATNFVTTFNARQDEYGNYKILQGEGEGVKDTLFWEFGKKIAHALGSDKDVAIVVPVENYSVKMMARLDLKELLLGRSE